jgi:hypothetical protein
MMKTPPDEKVGREDALQLVKEQVSKLPNDKLRAVVEVVEYLTAKESEAELTHIK